MSRGKVSSVALLALSAALLAAAPPAEKKKPPTFEVKDVKLTVSGPHAHDNVAVFLLHAKEQDPREFITLDEGLDKKLVAVSEKSQEQVNELVIENNSDRPLFLQEGDRVK